jgi:hypothetical protein
MVEELVLAYAAERSAEIEVEVPAELEARADPEAFERIVGNLIANALRYGEAPIRVTAEQRDRHFRDAIEDRGGGVPPEFAPTCSSGSHVAASAVHGRARGPGALDCAVLCVGPRRQADLRAGEAEGSALRARPTEFLISTSEATSNQTAENAENFPQG